jgi:hypothetical protein
MTEQRTRGSTEERLEAYLHAELHAAEGDFPSLPRTAASRRAFVAIGIGLVAVAALVALVVIRPVLLAGRGSAEAEASDGPFHLAFTLTKSTYLTTEPIEGSATLSVTDGLARTIWGPYQSPIGFSMIEVGGTRRMEAGFRQSCNPYSIGPDAPLTRPLTKSGAWSADDPNAAFYQEFFADERIHLPAGTWDISVVTDFSEDAGSPCSGVAHDPRATIRIEVRAPDEPTADLVTFEGEGFSFDYPSDWEVIRRYQHFGLHGPTVLAAVGIGGFDLGCTTTPDSVSCPNGPRWTVPTNGVVLAYHFGSWLGPIAPQPTPSLGPGDEWVEVGGRSAVLSRTDNSMIWHFPGAPEFIEARWGPDLSDVAPGRVDDVIASWHWASPPPGG